MRYIFTILFFTSTLFSLSLQQYIHQSIYNSNDAKNLIDTNALNNFDLNSAKHRFDFSYSPKSSISSSNDTDNISIGLQGDKENIYGGKVYGDIVYSNSKYDSGDTTDDTVTTIGYKQSLIRKFGEKYNTLELFKALKNNELLEYYNKEVKADIIIKAVELYYTALLNNIQKDIYKSSLKRAEKNYEASQAKQKAGIVSKVDVYRAKLSYLDDKNSLEDKKQTYQESLENLYFYINQDIQYAKNLDKTISKVILPLPKYDFIDSLDTTLSWQEMLTKESIIERELFNAKRDFNPDIELDMNYKRSEDTNEDSWNIALSSNYSFDHFNENIKYQKLIIEKRKLLREKESLKISIANNYRKLKYQYDTTKKNLKIYMMKEDIAKESLEIAKIRFERGLSDNMDILDAQNSYTNAQINLINARVQEQILFLKLLKKMNILDYEYLQKVYGE